MKCYVCGGEMRKAKRDIEANWKGRQLVFRGLEAWVCGNCGEQAYDPEDVGLMQNVMRGLELEEAPPQIMNVQEVAGSAEGEQSDGVCPCPFWQTAGREGRARVAVRTRSTPGRTAGA